MTKTAIQREIKSFWASIAASPNHPKAQDAIRRALEIVQRGQEPLEIASEDVKYNNGRGWCPMDVRFATSLLHQIKHSPLSEKQVVAAADLLGHYSRQLSENRLRLESRKQKELQLAIH